MTLHHVISIIAYVVSLSFNRVHWHCAFLGCCEAHARPSLPRGAFSSRLHAFAPFCSQVTTVFLNVMLLLRAAGKAVSF